MWYIIIKSEDKTSVQTYFFVNFNRDNIYLSPNPIKRSPKWFLVFINVY